MISLKWSSWRPRVLQFRMNLNLFIDILHGSSCISNNTFAVLAECCYHIIDFPYVDTGRPSLRCSWSGKNGEGASTKTCAIQRVTEILIFCSWQLFIRKLMKLAAVLIPRSLILMVMIKATMLMPWVQLHTWLCEFKATVFILPVVASWSSLNPSSWFYIEYQG